MWEVRAAEGRLDELVAYVAANADPAAQVYRAGGAAGAAGPGGSDARVVVIDPTGTGLADVPAELVARPPHAWAFEEVPRS
jgi:hypothetical protein